MLYNSMYAWGRGRRRERASIPRRAKRGQAYLSQKRECLPPRHTDAFYLSMQRLTGSYWTYRDTQAQAHTCMYANIQTNTNQPTTFKAPTIVCFCWIFIFISKRISHNIDTISPPGHPPWWDGGLSSDLISSHLVCVHVCKCLINLSMYRFMQGH